jgi:hypothetical protein
MWHLVVWHDTDMSYDVVFETRVAFLKVLIGHDMNNR